MKKIIASFWVDPQNCFTSQCPNELPVPDAEAIVPALLAQHDYADYQLLSMDVHPENADWETRDRAAIGKIITPPQHPNVDKYWPKHAINGTFGHQLIAGLPPHTDSEYYDCIVEKGTQSDCHPYGAIYLDLACQKPSPAFYFLKEKQITQVIIGGLATEFCVFETAMQIRRLGLSVILNSAGCRGFPGSAETAIEMLQKAGVQIAQTPADIIYALAR